MGGQHHLGLLVATLYAVTLLTTGASCKDSPAPKNGKDAADQGRVPSAGSGFSKDAGRASGSTADLGVARTCGGKKGGKLDPNAPRPRVFLSKARLAKLKTLWKKNTRHWASLKYAAGEDRLKLRAAAAAALLYAVTKKKKWATRAKQVALRFAKKNPKGVYTDNGNAYRAHGQNMALVYDWVYGELSSSEKRIIRSCAEKGALYHFKRRRRGKDSDEVVGGAKAALITAIAIAGDSKNADRLHKDALSHWEKGVPDENGHLHSIRGYVEGSIGGIWMEGNEYSPSTARYVLELVAAEKDATGRDLLCEVNQATGQDFEKNLVRATWHLDLPAHQDCFTYADIQDPNWPMQYESWGGLMAILAERLRGTKEGEWAQYFADYAPNRKLGKGAFLAGLEGEYGFWETTMPFYLLGGRSSAPTSLPLAHVARGAEIVLARTSHDKNANGVMIHAGSMYDVDHVHKDTGSFQLYRRGQWLTREVRGYGMWPHNARAHNTILIKGIGPAERAHYVYGPVKIGKTCLEKDVVYVGSDLTANFNLDKKRNKDWYRSPKDRAKHVLRQFAFIRPEGYLVVADKVLPLAKSMDSALVFLTMSKPKLGSRTIDSQSLLGSNLTRFKHKLGNQMLRINTVFPQSGHRYQLVDENAYYKVKRPKLNGLDRIPEQWEIHGRERRYHVLVALPKTSPYALHVFLGYDKGGSPPSVKPLQRAGRYGVRISGSGKPIEVWFDKDKLGGSFARAASKLDFSDCTQ